MKMDSLINPFRFPCPASSATKAQVWFELKSGGLRVLAIGLAIAMLILSLFAMGIPFFLFRFSAMISVFGAAPAALLIFGRNAFGIRRGQKRAYLSAFEATQPCGTAQLASVKLLVRTACVLVAMAAIGVSAWTSISLASAWEPVTSTENTRAPGLLLLRVRSDLARNYGEQQGYELAAQAVTTLVFVLVVVAALAAFTALRTRYPRRVLITGSVLLLCGLAFGIGSEFLPHAIRAALPWIVAAALAFTIVSLLRNGFADRALTTRYVCGALAISVANWVASLPVNFPTLSVGEVLLDTLLPLMIFVLAPWSLSRVRHT